MFCVGVFFGFSFFFLFKFIGYPPPFVFLLFIFLFFFLFRSYVCVCVSRFTCCCFVFPRYIVLDSERFTIPLPHPTAFKVCLNSFFFLSFLFDDILASVRFVPCCLLFVFLLCFFFEFVVCSSCSCSSNPPTCPRPTRFFYYPMSPPPTNQPINQPTSQLLTHTFIHVNVFRTITRYVIIACWNSSLCLSPSPSRALVYSTTLFRNSFRRITTPPQPRPAPPHLAPLKSSRVVTSRHESFLASRLSVSFLSLSV